MWPSSTTAHDQPSTLLDVFRARVAAAPRSPALAYFDTVMSFGELDTASDELAVALADGGFCAGDRAALYMQNMPQYVIAMLAIWKIAGIAVPVNPMLRPGEVAKLFVDAAPRVLIALDELHTAQLADALNTTAVERVITTSALDWQHAGDPRSLPTTRLTAEG
ncbi:MAG: long-chain acyl-CoA synthetase, partial [Mycobacterium sp.]|nr:long-chain acyl-CoA synthetase [Mycobacterium sp.]